MKTANRFNGGRVNRGIVLTGIAMWGAGLACGGGGAKPKADGDAGLGDAVDGDGISSTDGGPDTIVAGVTPVKLVISPTTPIMVTEGGMPGQFTVRFDRIWSSPITLTLVSANPNVATVVPETVTFGAGMTGPVTVMVLPMVDDDTADNTTSISVFSTETGSANVTVNVDDVDIQGLLVDPARVSMTEGRTEPLRVRLNKRPASSVVVTVATSNATKLSLSPTMLTFTPSNYSINQSVMLMAAQDDDANLDNVTVTLTATGNIAMLSVPVEITDDEIDYVIQVARAFYGS